VSLRCCKRLQCFFDKGPSLFLTTDTVSCAPGIGCLIGVGSNIDAEEHIPTAVRQMHSSFEAVQVSTFYWTKPLLDLDQDRYANGVVRVVTQLPVFELKELLRRFESEAGRRRSREHFAPRTLDLDLLTYGDGILPEAGLPDDDLLERDFVLLPAAELAPDWVHPEVGISLAQLAAERFPSAPNIIALADLF